MQKDLLLKLLPFFKAEKERRKVDLLRYDWANVARPNQLPPQGDWRVWLILAGRGFGKTRTGAETLRMWVQKGHCRRLALLGETEDEVRQVMIEGPSGILTVHPMAEKPKYEAGISDLRQMRKDVPADVSRGLPGTDSRFYLEP